MLKRSLWNTIAITFKTVGKQAAAMAESAKLLLFLVVAVICNFRLCSAETHTMTAEGFDVGRPVETACFGSDISFQTDEEIDGLYVGVPSSLFVGKDGGNTCGQKIRVSCKGGSHVCKNKETLTLTIIDTLDGDFVELSNKAFNIISDFDIGIIKVKVTSN